MQIRVLALLTLALAGCTDNNDPVSSGSDGPQILSMQPAPGTSYVAADQTFTVEFSEAMETSTVKAAYRVTTGDSTVHGRYSWDDGSTSMSFTPNAGLQPGGTVDIQWAQGMRSRRGQTLISQDGQVQTAFSFRCQVYVSPVDYESNGQRIFLTGMSASGEPVTFTMGEGFASFQMPGYAAATGRWSDTMRFGGVMGRGMMGGGMIGGSASGGYGMSCATCHGPEGAGGRYLAMGTIVTPNITYQELTEAESEDGHEHAPYTNDLILRAITEGVGSDGEPLDAFMPRWQMSKVDQQDLLDFLKSL